MFLRKYLKSMNSFSWNKINYMCKHTKCYSGTAIPVPCLDFDYLLNPSNLDTIRNNISLRKGVGDIDKVVELHDKLKGITDPEQRTMAERELLAEAAKIPNRTHPAVPTVESAELELRGPKTEFAFLPKEFEVLAEKLEGLRTRDLGISAGHKSYYFRNCLAQMEQALIKYFVTHLLKKNFKLISVPDMLHPKLIEYCGMNLNSERSQVYTLENGICLSGTAEMALASFYKNTTLNALKLPLKNVAVSRCFRAEISALHDERGIYRVHQFTKVEMFGITRNGSESDQLLEEFVSIQKEFYDALGLHYKLLDMAAQELGSPAYRKFDVEAWLPGRKLFGEISSASNCTDFQSRRLNTKYLHNGKEQFVHTVNGTACAVPRMLIALLETFQQENGAVKIPPVLQEYMNGQSVLYPKPETKSRMKVVKNAFDVPYIIM